MNQEIKQSILDKIKEYDRIIITRHTRPDGDAVGSTLGLQRILRLTYPQKEILLLNEDYSDYMAFLGKEDEAVPEQQYRDALLIVLDTATNDRISNRQFSLAKEIIKIDHHVDVEPYGDISWVEDGRSSACEMIADFYKTFREELKMDREAATCIYAGMVTDSGRFRFEATTGETLRMAAMLLDQGIDTETLYARLYLKEYEYKKFEADIFRRVKRTEHGVAYLHVDERMQKKFGLTREQASNCVSLLGEIKESIIWLAFIDNGDGTIRVRLRSRFVEINHLAERYHGGGHVCASGAVVSGRKEMNALIAEADALSKEFKANHFYL